MGGCASTHFLTAHEKRYRRAIKLYEVREVKALTNLVNRNRCFESTGELPLTLAAREGHEAVVQTLLRGGADCNRLDRNGKGALHIATYLNDEETVEILLRGRADPNRYDGSNMAPLHIACEKGYKNIVEKLLLAGANPNENRQSPAPLVYAVMNGQRECVEMMLEQGAEPNVADSKGNNLLSVAVANMDAAIVQALLDYGADPCAPSRTHENLLCVAAAQGSCDILQALIDKGCDVNVDREEEVPPLIAATATGHSDCVDILLAAGAVADCVDRKGNTPLFNAAMMIVDYDKELYYNKYFSNLYRNFSKYDPNGINTENATKCAMSLVQSGADLSIVWPKFVSVFPHPQGITFEQMVLCEVLIQAFGFQEIPQSKVRNFALNLLNLREYGLIKLLYSAGVEPDAEDLYTLSVRNDDTDRNMFRWVKRLRFRPRQLKDLCRKTIRRMLSWNVLYLVEFLDVPADVKEYVCIMDTEYYSRVEDGPTSTSG